MDHKEQTQRFSDEIQAVIDRYRLEYDLTYAQAVGVLHIKAHNLCAEGLNEDEGKD